MSKKPAQIIKKLYPELFYISNDELYFKDQAICKQPLLIESDIASGEINVYTNTFVTNVNSFNGVLFWISSMNDYGILQFNRYRDLSDETIVTLCDYNIEICYRPDFENTSSPLKDYDITEVYRRYTIYKIINE